MRLAEYAQLIGMFRTAFERRFDFVRTQAPHFDSHKPIAQVRVVFECAGRRAPDRRVVDVHAVRDHRRRGIRFGRRRSQYSHAVCNPKTETTPAPATRRDAAHGYLCSHFKIAVEPCDLAPLDAAEVGVQADAIGMPRREMQCDVAAVVHICACNREVRSEERDQLIRDGAGDCCHRRDELRAIRPARFEHAARNGAFEVCMLFDWLAQSRELVYEFDENDLESGPGKLDCIVDGGLSAVGANDQVDRAMLEMPAAVRETGACCAAPWGGVLVMQLFGLRSPVPSTLRLAS